MADANNTIKTRIQLKSDTEANWKKSVLVADGGEKVSGNSFVPLAGELIVYTTDATHSFCRLKVGDGVTNVIDLPFIDAGTINGEEVEIVKTNIRHITYWGPGKAANAVVENNTLKLTNGMLPQLATDILAVVTDI